MISPVCLLISVVMFSLLCNDVSIFQNVSEQITTYVLIQI